tara:strand:- start:8298 stop:8936 length:639 start_codon:yes stop_codon:yes gene_type:complete
MIPALLWLFACEGQQVTKTADNPSTGYINDHWSRIQPTQKKTIRTQVSPSYGRLGRRLTLAQLRTMIPKLFDGMTWEDSRGNNLFNRYARTLGEADYIYLTSTNRQATALFMKFMDDMATNLCDRAVSKDLAEKDESKRMVVLDQKDIDRTLRHLRLKFHTIYVPESTNKGIKQLRELYDNVLTQTGGSSSTSRAWRSVCYAVLTAPEFFAY